MLPSHSHLPILLQRGLFNGISRFAQLEARLAALPSAEEQFVAFAVFAEAFLAIRTLPQAAEIWPEGKIPLEARRRHALPERILGADGIFRTLTGEIHPYQLLFRPQRPPLSRKEVTPFLELAERVPQPMLFSNCTLLPPPLRNHTGFHCVLGNDLDRLNSRDFNAMRRWMQGGGLPLERLPPTPQQARYAATLQPHWEQQERLLGLVAPGVGVELLALQWAQGMGSGRTVLLLSPSLAHLRETLLLWRRHVVGSDLVTAWVHGEAPGATDAAQVRQGDWDLPLLTESEGVRRFLNGRFQGVRVLMATYSAARIVARALVGSAPLDLGIFLESQEGIADPFALEESNLPLRKRLLLSASSQHASTSSRDAEGEPKRLWNLAEHPLYGPAIPVAPLDKAVADGVVRPWRLCMAIVSPQTTLGEEAQRLHISAAALPMLVARSGARHVQAYHGSPQEARAFAELPLRPWQSGATVAETQEEPPQPPALSIVSPTTGASPPTPTRDSVPGPCQGDNPPGPLVMDETMIKAQPPEHLSLCLEGSATAAEREALLRRYGQAERAILNTARCLSDGISPPAADLLFFSASPKKVKWDVARAMGAILSPSAAHSTEPPGATQAWLSVPLVLAASPPESPVESLMERTLASAQTLWELLQVLRELDPSLEEQIVQAGMRYGKTGAWPSHGLDGEGDPLMERFAVVGADDLPPEWRRLFWQQFLWQITSPWDRLFGQWQQNPEGKDAALQGWVEQQRRACRKGILRSDRKLRLQQAGFVWDLQQAAWDNQWQALQAFHRQHGHGRVPEHWPENPALAEWAKQQRQHWAKGLLSTQRMERLDALHFCWNLEQARWEGQFHAFLHFRQHQGHGKIPELWPENPALAFWAKEQRKEYSQGKLAPERQSLLEELGFCWDLEAAYWEEMFASLQHYREIHGHCLLPPSWPENPLLADWVGKQRRDWRGGRLSEERISRLNGLDFVWDPEEKAWQEQWALLAEFHAVHGHCHLPDEQTELAEWLRQQRRLAIKNGLSPERRARLESLNVIWDAQEAEWDAMLVALQRFRAEHNHCIIPTRLPENPALARWVTTVRRHHANGALSPEKVQQLTALGFVWDAKAILWEEMFAAMAEFRRRHGNCLVPESYQENNQLAWWVVTQRKAYKSGQLEADRIERLNALGFFWDPLEVQWYEMYLALVHYREQHGRCVITRGTGDPHLSAWMATQRQARLHGHLSPVRIERLDALGFVWDPKEVILEEMLAELTDFMRQHGHCNVPVPWAHNPALGLWVQFQRQEYHKARLDPKRIERLEALGFVWS
ncbi:MAG: Helicase associated domain protein [Magnetococcales bacterium]|nr:Helicase associated domain protein [Magnetococcales bacterium]